MTMGIVLVACLAATVDGVPEARMMSTGSFTNSVANSGQKVIARL